MLVGFLAGADQGRVGDHIRRNSLLLHCLKELKNQIGLIFQGTDQSAVCDYIGHHTLLLHRFKNVQGLLRPIALLTGANHDSEILATRNTSYPGS